jgi:hypothetical protein
VNGGKLQCITLTADGAAQTTVDSGFSLVADTMTNLEVILNANATNATFKINGNIVAEITTTLHPVNSSLGAGVSVIRSTGYGATETSVYVDDQRLMIEPTIDRW